MTEFQPISVNGEYSSYQVLVDDRKVAWDRLCEFEQLAVVLTDAPKGTVALERGASGKQGAFVRFHYNLGPQANNMRLDTVYTFKEVDHNQHRMVISSTFESQGVAGDTREILITVSEAQVEKSKYVVTFKVNFNQDEYMLKAMRRDTWKDCLCLAPCLIPIYTNGTKKSNKKWQVAQRKKLVDFLGGVNMEVFPVTETTYKV